MNYPSPAQMDLIRRLSGVSVSAAAQDYGFSAGHALSARDASDIIDHLQAAVAPILTDAELADLRAARAEIRARDDAAAAAEVARLKSAAADTARFDAILVERGLDHLTGADRREARRLIRREIEAQA